jgi:hypothetical protein
VFRSIGEMFYRDPTAESPELARYRYGQRIIWWGFFLIGAITITAILKYDDPSKVGVVLSTVTGVVGTVIGAFFGVAAGSAGRERSESITRQLLAESSAERAKAALESSS